MDETYSLMEFLQALATDTGLRNGFTHDPQAALHEYGLDHLSPADVHDALVLVEDNQTADFSRDYDTGYNAIHLPPPPPDHDFASPEQAHHAAVSYLDSYVTNNYVDDHSVDQQIDAGGGHFDQWIDVDSTLASGDGAVSAGGDIHRSTITSGDHDQVRAGNVRGDGNVVGDRDRVGDHTSAFGSGNATGTHVGGDADVGDGGAFASGGNASVDNSDHSLHGVGHTWTDNSVNDSYKDSSDHGVHGSGNTHVDASTHDSFDDNSQHTTTGSFDDESDEHVSTDNSQHHVGDADLH